MESSGRRGGGRWRLQVSPLEECDSFIFRYGTRTDFIIIIG